MCRCQFQASCSGCHHTTNRRQFVRGSAAAAAALALGVQVGRANAPQPGKPRVALVFLSKQGSSWPWPEFDVKRREKEIQTLLEQGCPEVEFVPTVIQEPADVQRALALKNKVDGYLVYIISLNWDLQRSLTQIGQLGRPLLVADEFLGGSGVFLRGTSDLYRQNIPAAAVSTTRLSDLVAVAHCFAGVNRPGTTPESFARQCTAEYRKTFPTTGPMQCLDDPVPLTDIAECVKRFRETEFLIVGNGKPGQRRDFLGACGIDVGFDELTALYDQVDRDQASEWSQRWSKTAEKIVEANPDWIDKAGAIYLATLELLKKYGTDTVTMNCLGGFHRGELPAYPCLGFMQILDDGGQGVCEAMPDDTLSMLMARILTGRPGYVSDPALDTSKNQIVYAHCVATTKPFGPDSAANKFRIRTLHDRDPRGTCAESFLPEGYMTTSFRTNFARKEMVLHQAKAVGNLNADRGCRSQLVGEVHGDIGKLFDQWDHFSWHRVTLFGDVREPLTEFGQALGLTVIEEA
jgi:hypothetical protein